LRHASVLTRSTVIVVLMMTVTGCAIAVSDRAICDGTRQSRTEHAAALAKDGGALSVVTGAHLIRQIDAACST
jgi:hypothetical protein